MEVLISNNKTATAHIRPVMIEIKETKFDRSLILTPRDMKAVEAMIGKAN